jgi:hypothetical protein
MRYTRNIRIVRRRTLGKFVYEGMGTVPEEQGVVWARAG